MTFDELKEKAHSLFPKAQALLGPRGSTSHPRGK